VCFAGLLSYYNKKELVSVWNTCCGQIACDALKNIPHLETNICDMLLTALEVPSK
jgi:hypothetical protein